MAAPCVAASACEKEREKWREGMMRREDKADDGKVKEQVSGSSSPAWAQLELAA